MNIAVWAQIPQGVSTAGVEGGESDTVSRYDLLAVLQGVELMEAGVADHVHLFTVGNIAEVGALRVALALGADDLTAIADPRMAHANSLGMARVLAAAIGQADDVRLVLCGERTEADHLARVPALLADQLGWPRVSSVCAFETNGATFRATRDAGGGHREVVSGSLPAVVTCDEGLVQERHATLPQLMAATRKAVHQTSLDVLGLDGSDVAPAASG